MGAWVLTIGSLFSGIGGLELGLERAGLGPVLWQAEIDPFCRSVLARHWPGVHRYLDVRSVRAAAEYAPASERPLKPPPMGAEDVDLICGGFPCQNISSANVKTRNGLAGAKSGLWADFRRVVDELQPRWVVVENSPEWRSWLPDVELELREMGYGPKSYRIAAENVGAPHARPRVFAIAYADGEREPASAIDAQVARVREASAPLWDGRKGPPGGYRVDDGVPRGVDRSRALGNAVAPAVAEVIGRVIAEALS